MNLALRHWGCGMLARLLIASGAVRRARRRIAARNAITCVYFHNPDRALFERSIEWLRRNGYTFVSADRLLAILRGETPAPPLPVWISLDDAYAEWAETVAPVARALGVPVTLFVPSGVVAGNGMFPWIHDAGYRSEDPVFHPPSRRPAGAREALTAAQIAEWAAWPEITIGGHTVNHSVMTLCSGAELEAEIAGCRRTLEAWTRRPVTAFAYPAGRHDARCPALLREHGFTLAATTEPAFCQPGADPLLVPRLCVPDGVTFAEAVCNMVGVWRPFIERVKSAKGPARRPPASRVTPALEARRGSALREFQSALPAPHPPPAKRPHGIDSREHPCTFTVEQPAAQRSRTREPGEEARVSAPLHCELVTAFDRLEALSPHWKRWVDADPQATVFHRWEWARASWKAYGASISLFAVAVFRGDAPAGILPLIRRGDTLEFLGAPDADYAGLLCDPGQEIAVLDAALAFLLRSPEPWRGAALMNVPAHSRLAAAIPHLRPGLGRHLQLVYRCPCPAVTVDRGNPQALGELIDKEQLRRYDRKLGKRGTLTWRHLETREEACAHLAGFFRQHTARWAMNGVRSQFLRAEARAFFEALIGEFDPGGDLRFGVLELDGGPVAYHFGFLHRGTLTWYKPAFHVDFWDYCPGDILIRRLLGYVRDAGLREFDFTIGDEAFKRRFANTVRSNAILYIERHPYRPRSLAIAAVRRAQDAVRRRPEWKARLAFWAQRAQAWNRRRHGMLGRALAWIWRREETRLWVHTGGAAIPPGYRVMEATLDTLATFAVQCDPAPPAETLRAWRQQLKRGDRFYVVSGPGAETAVFRLAPLDDAPLSGMAIQESWTAPHRATAIAPQALQALAGHPGVAPVWMESGAPGWTAAGFEPRYRRMRRVILGSLRQQWTAEPGTAPNQSAREAVHACS